MHEVSEFFVPESCHICYLHRAGAGEYHAAEEEGRDGDRLDSQQAAGEISSSAGGMPTKQYLHPKPPLALDMPDIEEEGGGGGGVTPLSSSSIEVKVKEKGISIQVGMPDDDDLCNSVSDLDSDHWSENDDEDDICLPATRGFMKNHCQREGSGRYAIKRIKNDLSRIGGEDAALDLALEAKFLTVLMHPNIVKLRGKVGVPGSLQFGFIMDRLYATLGEKYQQWAKVERKLKGFKGMKTLVNKKSRKELRDLWMERALALYDVSRAMKYLHDYRYVPFSCGCDLNAG